MDVEKAHVQNDWPYDERRCTANKLFYYFDLRVRVRNVFNEKSFELNVCQTKDR